MGFQKGNKTKSQFRKGHIQIVGAGFQKGHKDFEGRVINGDCIEIMRKIPENSVDAVITDPPAGISFMNRGWDEDKGGRDHWIAWMQEVATECKRVLKPGGHAFVWAIPRTSHWTATAWENAGFEIREIVAHVFGSGFPKSHNIGVAVDKLQGNEREDCGKYVSPENTSGGKGRKFCHGGQPLDGLPNITKGTSEWEGWGSALKPAREDWLLMRKPFEKGLTIAENCLKYGTGGINIDESRVEHNENLSVIRGIQSPQKVEFYNGKKILLGDIKVSKPTKVKFYKKLDTRNQGWGFKAMSRGNQGRFPANLILSDSEEVRECFPETKPATSRTTNKILGVTNFKAGDAGEVYNDGGGNASRFFKSIIYTAKASKSERNKGCEGLFILKDNIPTEDIDEIKHLLSI